MAWGIIVIVGSSDELAAVLDSNNGDWSSTKVSQIAIM